MFWNRRPPARVLGSLLLFALLLSPAILFAGEIPWSLIPVDVKWGLPPLIVIYVWIALVTLFMVRVVDRRPVTSVGLGLHPWTTREVGLGLLLGSGLALLAILPTVFAEGVIFWTGEWQYVWDDALLIVIFATGEEILLRGYILQRVAELIGDGAAVIALAVAFVLLHLANVGLTPLAGLNIFLAGLLFGALWGVTRSLWVPVGAHVGWNLFVGPLSDLPVSGIEMDHSVFHLAVGLPDWVTGGTFGPEGGVVCTAVLVAGIALVLTSDRFRIAPWTFSRMYWGEVRRRHSEANKPFSE